MQRCEQYDPGQGVCKMLVDTGACVNVRRSALPESMQCEAPRCTAPFENVLSETQVDPTLISTRVGICAIRAVDVVFALF